MLTYSVGKIVYVLNDFWKSQRQLKLLLFVTTLYASVMTSMHTKSRWLELRRQQCPIINGDNYIALSWAVAICRRAICIED